MLIRKLSGTFSIEFERSPVLEGGRKTNSRGRSSRLMERLMVVAALDELVLEGSVSCAKEPVVDPLF